MKNYKKLLEDLYLENGITLFVELLILTAFYYLTLLGVGIDVPHTLLLFCFLLISAVTVIMPFDILIASRLSLIKMKNELPPSQSSQYPGHIKNPGFGLLAEFFAVGIGLGVILVILLKITGAASFAGGRNLLSLLILLAFVYPVILVITTILLFRHLKKDILNTAYMLNNKLKSKKESLFFYIVHNYLPFWIPVLTLVLTGFFLVGKQSPVEHYEDLATLAISKAIDVGILCLIMTFWLWYSSKSQVKVDYFFGKVAKTRPLSLLKLIVSFILVLLLSGLAVCLLIAVIKSEHVIYSPYFLVLIKIVLPICTAIFGMYLGIAWGITRAEKKNG